jgi:hypothetical protein
MFFGWREREVALRRAALQARSAALRARVVEESTVLQRPLRMADATYRGWRWLQVHPEVVVGTVVVVAVLRPRRALALLRWTWKGWRAWCKLRSWAAEAQGDIARVGVRPVSH